MEGTHRQHQHQINWLAAYGASVKNVIFSDDAIFRRLSRADNAFGKIKRQRTCITMDDTKHTMVRSIFEKLVMEYVRFGLGAMCSLVAGPKLRDTYDMCVPVT